MNQRQRRTVENQIKRLKDHNLGSHITHQSQEVKDAVALLNSKGYEVVGRLYLDTWVVPSLEYMLSDNVETQKLGERLSRP